MSFIRRFHLFYISQHSLSRGSLWSSLRNAWKTKPQKAKKYYYKYIRYDDSNFKLKMFSIEEMADIKIIFDIRLGRHHFILDDLPF